MRSYHTLLRTDPVGEKISQRVREFRNLQSLKPLHGNLVSERKHFNAHTLRPGLD